MISAAGDTPEGLSLALSRGLLHEPASPSGGGRQLGIPIEGFHPRSYLDRRGLKDLSRTSQLACAAAARLSSAVTGLPPAAVGVALGTAWGSTKSVVDLESEARTLGPRLVNPLLFAESVANVPAGQVSIAFGWSAFNLTVSSAQCSGLDAIREACDLLEDERAAAAVAGGADELSIPMHLSLAAGGLIAATSGSLPFARGRTGPVCGEGGCLVLLEPAAGARERGARPLARLLAASGRLSIRPRTSGVPRAEEIADLLATLLAEADTPARRVDLIVASADGGLDGDRREAVALAQVFGEGENAPAVVIPKAILGETWGASGPIGVVVALEAMRTGHIPARPRGLILDPDLPALNIPERALSRRVSTALVLARGCTGYASGLLLSSMDHTDAR